MDNIKKYINLHKGKKAIICGSGPSINEINFNLVSDDYIIFCCNQSVTALDKCHYFCITDNAVICMDFFEHGAKICNEFIVMGPFANPAEIMSNNHKTEIANKYAELIKNKSKFFKREGNLPFSKKGPVMEGPSIGKDVVHVTTHLAYLFGCREIVLAGVDLTTKGGVYCKPTSYNNEVNWEGVAMENNDELLDNSFKGWEEIKEKTKDVKFLNASSRSRLTELFDTIEIETLYTHSSGS
jgi:hypothetical protein